MKLIFSERQKELFKEAGLLYPPDNDFTDIQLVEIEEKLSDYMLTDCLGKDQAMTPKAREYLAMLDMLS